MIERVVFEEAVLLRMTHGKANALDLGFLRGLTAAFRAEAGGSHPVILTGVGGIFSAGVDLFRLMEGGASYVGEFIPALSECFFTLFTHPTPVIAAINGHAIAGGCLLACACDRRIMTRGRGRIGVPELKVGVPFPWLAVEILRYAMPAPTAQEVCLMGERYSPEDALTRGIVDELCAEPDLMVRSRSIARALGAAPPATFRATKALLRGPVIDGWKQFGATSDQRTVELWGTAEVQGAVRKYVDATLK